MVAPFDLTLQNKITRMQVGFPHCMYIQYQLIRATQHVADLNEPRSRTKNCITNINNVHLWDPNHHFPHYFPICITDTIFAFFFFYRIIHFFCLFGGGAGQRTARMASSNTFFKPFCVNAEHSRYFTAPISFCICKLWEYEMGAMCFWRSRAIVSGSSRRSSLVPTRIMGVLGAWWLISGYHYIISISDPLSIVASFSSSLPWSWHFQKRAGWRARSKSKTRRFEDRTMVSIGRNLLGLLYPTIPNWLVCRRPLRLLNSYQSW